MWEEREQYLIELAEEQDVPEEIVFAFAELLGPSEDFDGLVTMVEDWRESHLDEIA